MAVAVVFDHPRRHLGTRLGAQATAAAGVLVTGLGLTVGTAATVGAVLLLGALAGGALPADVLATLPPQVASLAADRAADLVPQAVRVAVALVVAAVLVRAGLALLRRRRRAVLFLRRFGFDDATRAVTAATGALGRSWRLVTLDDSAVEPVGVRRSVVVRASRKVSGWVSLAVVVAVGVAVYRLSRREDLIGSELVLPDPFGWRGELGQMGEIVLALAWLAAFPVVLGLGLLLVRLVMLPARTYTRRVQRAATAAAALAEVPVRTVDDVEAVAATVEEMKRRVFSPQLMVVRSENAVWHDAVQRLLLCTEVTLVDVSRPTESLLWEIGELTATDDGRCVFVGDYERLARFLPDVGRGGVPDGWPVYRYDPLAAGPETVIGRILALLDGREVLAYGDGRDALGRFARALQGRLVEAATAAVATRRAG